MLSDAFEQWLKRSQKEKGIAIGKGMGMEMGFERERRWESNKEWNRSEVSGARGICGVNLHSRKATNSTNHHRMDKIMGSGVRKTTRAIVLPSML